MMEKLSAPQVPLLHVLVGSISFTFLRLGRAQTHIGLKAMIAEIDEDSDGQISFREFLLIFRKVCSPLLLLTAKAFIFVCSKQAARGELKADGLSSIATTINVAEVFTVLTFVLIRY